MTNKYKSSLCESYKDFAFIFDKDLGLYVVSLEPLDINSVDTVFINITDENKKDSIDEVIAYVDDYYNSNSEYETVTEDIEETVETVEEDSLKQFYGDLFVVELYRKDDGEKELIEFTDVNSAQDYIDKLKIDNDEFFSKALLLDENSNVLDSWVYYATNNEDDSHTEEVVNENIDEENLEEDIVEPVVEVPVVVEIPVEDESTSDIDTVATNSEWAKSIDVAYNNAVVFANNLRMLHWYAKGSIFDTAHAVFEEYTNFANSNVDFLAELLMELDIKPINPQFTKPSTVTVLEESAIEQDLMNCLITNINEFCEVLYEARNTDNLAQDIVSEFDSIIRYWNKENNYKNKRRRRN